MSLTARPRVLIVDDFPAIVIALGRLLARDCDVVASVTDGSAALEAARRLQPDLVVLDLNMPKVNGLEACRQITQTSPHVKVVVVTAMSDPTIMRAAFAAGAAAFVPKHAVAQDLPSVIKRVCADRQSCPTPNDEHVAAASSV